MAQPERQKATNVARSPRTTVLIVDDELAFHETVSRDLEDLGAVKVRVPGGETVYAIPEYEPARLAPEDHLRRVMGAVLQTSQRDTVWDEHEAIAQAIAAGQGRRAAELIEQHSTKASHALAIRLNQVLTLTSGDKS